MMTAEMILTVADLEKRRLYWSSSHWKEKPQRRIQQAQPQRRKAQESGQRMIQPLRQKMIQ